MSLLQRAVLGLKTRAAGALASVWDNRGTWFPWIREPYTGAWQRNDEWTTDTVLAHHAVYSCITRIAQDVGKLRPKLIEQDGNGIWTETESAAFSPVLRRPNRFQNHIQFKEWWVTSKLTHGNTYVLLRRDARGVVDAMYVLEPSRVTVMVSPDGEVFYELRADNLAGMETDRVAVPASEIIHDRMNCLFHPLVGVSPLFASGNAAHLGLQIQRNSTAFFGNGSNPGGILSTVQDITPKKSLELSETWNSQFAGENRGKVAVLGSGMKFEAMRMTAVDSQMLEHLKWTAETVCSAFHVPAFKVGVGSQPTYANAEIANQVYYSDCLQSHIEQFELCINEALGLTTKVGDRGPMGVELDLDGLLRMDQSAQIEMLTEASGGAVFTPNEARRRVNLPPKPGGDELWKQQQDHSLKALAERDRNDPFAKPLAAAPAPPATPPDQEDAEERAAFARLVARRARTFRMRTAA